jgi:hypothetical protein
MLGAVKDEGTEGEAPLFRVLARRWKSLTPSKHERPRLSSVASTEEPPKAPRAWIAKPRQLYAHQKLKDKPARSWNPWLWVK